MFRRSIALGMILSVILRANGAFAECPLLRHTTYVALLVEKGAEVRIAVECKRHGSSYSDILRYALINKTGEDIERGGVMIDEERTISFMAEYSGLYLIELSSGWNLCRVKEVNVPWAVVVSKRLNLRTVGTVGRLYFYVPVGARRFEVFIQCDVTREGAKLCVFDPSGEAVLKQSGDFDKITRFEINVPEGLDGKCWSFSITRPEQRGLVLDDAWLYFGEAIPGYVSTRAEWAERFGKRITE